MRRTYLMSVEQICTIIAALMLASCVRVNAQSASFADFVEHWGRDEIRVFPSHVVNDVSDRGNRNAYNFGGFFKSASALTMKISNLPNNFLVQDCSGVSLSMRGASLCNHVSLVRQVISKEQVVRVDAKWIVATMQNEHVLWNGSTMNDPRCAMCLDIFPPVWSNVQMNPAIWPLAFLDLSGPEPAAACFLNVSPESPLEHFGRQPLFCKLNLLVDHIPNRIKA